MRVAATEETVGEVYNLGSGGPISVKKAAQHVIEAVGRGCIRSVPYPPAKKAIEVGDYYADFQKIQKATGWNPTIKLSEGISRTVAYYNQCKEHYW